MAYAQKHEKFRVTNLGAQMIDMKDGYMRLNAEPVPLQQQMQWGKRRASNMGPQLQCSKR